MAVLSAILVLAAITAANGFNFCPKIQEINWEIELLLPHWECNKFYQCTHGRPVEMICPKGLYFSIIKNKCDWRDLVRCGDRIILDRPEHDGLEIPQTTESPEKNNTVVEPQKPEGPEIELLPNGCPVDPEIHWLLPNEKFCNLFYYCVEGERELRRCPFWLHFNRKLQVCDWPKNSGCIEIFAA